MGICEESLFKKVYFNHNIALQRFLLSKGISLTDVADIVQESFLKLWKNCSKVNEDKAKSYLFTISNNTFIDNYRKGKTQLKIKENYTVKQTTNDPQFGMEMQEFKDKLEKCIDTMTPGSKEVFLLHRFNDMKYKEIAQSLEISVKAVEKRMHKALQHLTKQKIFLKK